MGFRRALNVKSRSGGDYSNYGVWGGESETASTIMASVQPTTGRERNNIPEGYHPTSSFLLITDSELNIAEEEGQRGDIVEYNGEWYTVVVRERWQNDVINHYAYIIALPDSAAARS